MKTTVDLPDELFRALKYRAARENRRLKVVLAEAVARGLAAPPSTGAPDKLPAPVKLRGGKLTTDEIEAAIASGRE